MNMKLSGKRLVQDLGRVEEGKNIKIHCIKFFKLHIYENSNRCKNKTKEATSKKGENTDEDRRD